MGQDGIKCDVCGLNEAAYKTGGKKTCPMCESKEQRKDDPIFVRHTNKTYQRRPK